MFSTLIIATVTALFLSCVTSITEAALYSVPASFVRSKAEAGGAAWRLLHRFKSDMSQPIAAVLLLNTLSNIVGATITGAAAADALGPIGFVWFSVCFTLAALLIGEILPKVIGVAYCRQLAVLTVYPLSMVMTALKPLLFLIDLITRRFSAKGNTPISSEEILSMAKAAGEGGGLDRLEENVIDNVIRLDNLTVADVLTPRVVVFRVPETLTLGEVEREISQWSHSRVPIHPSQEPEHLTGYVTQRDVYRELLKGDRVRSLKDIARSLNSVPEVMPVDKLLLHMIEKKEQICAAVDEHGGLAGIITLEDILEEVVGQEILDEYDTISDLRAAARQMRASARRGRAIK